MSADDDIQKWHSLMQERMSLCKEAARLYHNLGVDAQQTVRNYWEEIPNLEDRIRQLDFQTYALTLVGSFEFFSCLFTWNPILLGVAGILLIALVITWSRPAALERAMLRLKNGLRDAEALAEQQRKNERREEAHFLATKALYDFAAPRLLEYDTDEEFRNECNRLKDEMNSYNVP